MNKYELLQMDPRDALPAVEGDAYCDKVDKIVGRTYPNFLIRQLRISLDLFVRLIRCQLVTDAQ